MADPNASVCFDGFHDTFSDLDSVLAVITGDQGYDYLDYLVGNCSTVCPAALGDGNPDLAGIGVSSNHDSPPSMIPACMYT